MENAKITRDYQLTIEGINDDKKYDMIWVILCDKNNKYRVYHFEGKYATFFGETYSLAW